MKKAFEILDEDDDIIVVNKGAHALSIPDRFDPTLPNLRDILIKKYGEIYVVHRLDKETTGVMVFAKTSEAHSTLSASWADGEVKKNYLALTLRPAESKGTITASLQEHPHKKGQYITSVNGKSAHTTYEVIEAWQRYALLKVSILTGRTHQIRAHMKHIGAPLLVDQKYGVSDEFYLSSIKKVKYKRNQEVRPLLQRSSLHAHQLILAHPSTKKQTIYEAPLHKDMKAVVYQLNKKASKEI